MFLAWNYTIELFFWIVLGAVILVSLTILFAGPGFRSKKSETSEETLSLTGENVDSPEGSILDQDTASDRVEEELEILEEIEKGETAWTRLRGWVRNIPTRLGRWIRNIPTRLRRLGKWIRNIPARLVREIRNIPARLRRLGRWIRNIPARLVRGIRNILRFLREEWKAIVVGIGFCFYSGLVCVLGALIVFETLIAYERIEITGEWGGITLETWIFRLALIFGATIFLTGVISAYSFFTDNPKWSKNSCRAAAIVLLLFIFFGLSVADIDWPTDSPGTPLDDEQWWRWERDLETAGIPSIYLMFASLLFSGDLKRIWGLLRKEWVAIVRGTEVCYSLCVCVLGAWILYTVWGTSCGEHTCVPTLSAIMTVFGGAICLTGAISTYSFLTENQEWSRNSRRATTIVLLLLCIFYLVAGEFHILTKEDLIWPSSDVEGGAWRSAQNRLEEAGIVSFYLMFASLLFSGDLKRLWERILSNERVKQLGEALGTDPRLLFLIGAIALAFGIIPAALIAVFILVYQNWDKIVSFFSSD